MFNFWKPGRKTREEQIRELQRQRPGVTVGGDHVRVAIPANQEDVAWLLRLPSGFPSQPPSVQIDARHPVRHPRLDPNTRYLRVDYTQSWRTESTLSELANHLEALLTHEPLAVERPGMEVFPIQKPPHTPLGCHFDRCVLVRVLPGTPAQRNGLEAMVGRPCLRVNDRPVHSDDQIKKHCSGQAVVLSFPSAQKRPAPQQHQPPPLTDLAPRAQQVPAPAAPAPAPAPPAVPKEEFPLPPVPASFGLEEKTCGELEVLSSNASAFDDLFWDSDFRQRADAVARGAEEKENVALVARCNAVDEEAAVRRRCDALRSRKAAAAARLAELAARSEAVKRGLSPAAVAQEAAEEVAALREKGKAVEESVLAGAATLDDFVAVRKEYYTLKRAAAAYQSCHG